VTNLALASDRFQATRPSPDATAFEVMFRFLETDVRVVSANVGLLQHWAAVYGAFRAPPGPAAITLRVHGVDGAPTPGHVTIQSEQGLWRWQGRGEVLPPLATPPLDRWVPLQGTAVSRAGQAVLLVGGPRTGKTVLAMSMVARGASLLADGLLPLDPGDLLVAPFPKAVRLRREALSLLSIEPAHQALTPFRTWAGAVEWRADPRALLGPRAGRAAAEVAGIVFLQTAARAEEPRLVPVRPDQALLRLGRHLSQPPADPDATRHALAKLCRQVPAYTLVAGPPARGAELVGQLLAA
jgi:hypothetical protein